MDQCTRQAGPLARARGHRVRSFLFASSRRDIVPSPAAVQGDPEHGRVVAFNHGYKFESRGLLGLHRFFSPTPLTVCRHIDFRETACAFELKITVSIIGDASHLKVFVVTLGCGCRARFLDIAKLGGRGRKIDESNRSDLASFDVLVKLQHQLVFNSGLAALLLVSNDGAWAAGPTSRAPKNTTNRLFNSMKSPFSVRL